MIARHAEPALFVARPDAAQTIAEDAFAALRKWVHYAADAETHPGLVYGGDEAVTRSGVAALPWRQL